MITGMVLGALTYVPIYQGMEHFTLLPGGPDFMMLTFLVFIQVIYVTMVYGPIAAFLVELFPTNIRYTSMSLPYHIGNGVFGGLVPFIGTAIVAATNNHFAGLIYPIAIALISALIGGIYIKEKRDIKWHE